MPGRIRTRAWCSHRDWRRSRMASSAHFWVAVVLDPDGLYEYLGLPCAFASYG